MAMASPNWNTFSSQRMGRSHPSPLLVGKVMSPVMRFFPLTSLWVMTFSTPGIFSASEVSMERMLAWDTLACTSASRKVPGGHLQADVGAIVEHAGDLGNGRGTRIFAPPDAAVLRKFKRQLGGRHLPPHHLGRIHDGIDQGFVAGAAAGVPMLLEPIPDFFTGGSRCFHPGALWPKR